MNRQLLIISTVVALVVGMAGCGNLINRDLIEVAEVHGKSITRGDLTQALKRLPPEEKPVIRNQSDVLQALEHHIDGLIKAELATKLEAEGKIEIPREAAMRQLYAREPHMAASKEELMGSGLSELEAEAFVQNREERIDKIRQDLLQEVAVGYRMRQALETKEVTIADEEYAREFELRKDQLFNPEVVEFKGIYIPQTVADAEKKALEVRRRLQGGESVDTVTAEYVQDQAGFALQAALPNTGEAKFQSFWQQASGAERGMVIGPVVVHDWETIQADSQGQRRTVKLPESWLVAEVIRHEEPTPKTLDQAKADLAPALLYVKVMNRMREEAGVKIFEDQLPDPSLYDEDRPTSVFDTQKTE